MNRALLAVLVTAAALILPTAASAQTPEPPTFPTQAEMVTVDVVVTDDNGVPLRGLKKEDFVIQDEGQAQPLVLFEAIESPTAPSRAASWGSVSDNLPSGGVRPLIVIVFDEPHLTPANVELARDELRKLPTQREMGARTSSEPAAYSPRPAPRCHSATATGAIAARATKLLSAIAAATPMPVASRPSQSVPSGGTGSPRRRKRAARARIQSSTSSMLPSVNRWSRPTLLR